MPHRNQQDWTAIWIELGKLQAHTLENRRLLSDLVAMLVRHVDFRFSHLHADVRAAIMQNQTSSTSSASQDEHSLVPMILRPAFKVGRLIGNVAWLVPYIVSGLSAGIAAAIAFAKWVLPHVLG